MRNALEECKHEIARLKQEKATTIENNKKATCECTPNEKLRARIQATKYNANINDLLCLEKIVSDQQKRIDELKHDNVLLRQKYENLKFKFAYQTYKN